MEGDDRIGERQDLGGANIWTAQVKSNIVWMGTTRVKSNPRLIFKWKWLDALFMQSYSGIFVSMLGKSKSNKI